jgi:release factor glutamine methyltransferase
MSANSKQPVQTINQWLERATEKLARAKVPTARLDAEILLCFMLGVDRTWLIAHGEDSLHATALKFKGSKRRGSLLEHGEELLLRRLNREPIAYITGKKEFYGHEFIVTPSVLIPRPETETLIDIVRELKLPEKPVICDVGTGSGCIAVSVALSLPSAQVFAIDISPDSLTVARKNAKRLGAKVNFREDNLLSNHFTTGGVDVICANLPYVNEKWKVSPELTFEPKHALFASKNGLELIEQLIDQSYARLNPGGFLLLEADPEQHSEIINYAKPDLILDKTSDYAVLLRKP